MKKKIQKKEDLINSHLPAAIKERLGKKVQHSYLKDFIYGAIDGSVTTFAVVSGVIGAGLESKIIIILGLANLIADGFSMAVSNFLGTRAEEQLREQIRKSEMEHIRHIPEGEKEEIRQIFEKKGFEGKDLERAVKIITSDPKQWIDTMITEEFGLSLNGPSAIKAAMATFISFIVIGSLPLLIFIYELMAGYSVSHPFLYSSLMTGSAFFIVGAMKGRFVGQKWFFSGLETLFVGAIASSLAYLVGVLLRSLV